MGSNLQLSSLNPLNETNYFVNVHGRVFILLYDSVYLYERVYVSIDFPGGSTNTITVITCFFKPVFIFCWEKCPTFGWFTSLSACRRQVSIQAKGRC